MFSHRIFTARLTREGLNRPTVSRVVLSRERKDRKKPIKRAMEVKPKIPLDTFANILQN